MKRILIIEDDKYLINAYRVKLEKDGYEVKIAKDGQAGLKEVKKFQPDLILLDLVIPEMDGFEFLETFNQLKLNIPVLVVTNLGQQADIKRCKDLGAVDYVLKSDISINSLVEKIEGLL